MMYLDTILSLDPCDKAREWLVMHKEMPDQIVFNTCTNGAWLWWLYKTLDLVTAHQSAEFALRCANLPATQNLLPESSGEAMVVVGEWLRGLATDEQLAKAVSVAHAEVKKAIPESLYAVHASSYTAHAARFANHVVNAADKTDAAYAAYYAGDAGCGAAYCVAELSSPNNIATIAREFVGFDQLENALKIRTLPNV